MQTKMTHLQEAAELETAIEKLDAKHEAAKAKAAEKHVAKLRDLEAAHKEDEKAIRAVYSAEAVALYDRLQSEKGKEKSDG